MVEMYSMEHFATTRKDGMSVETWECDVQNG